MKRLLALVAGGLGLRAFLRRRSRAAASPSPAADLRAKLAQTKSPETQTKSPEAQTKSPETQTKPPEPPPQAPPEAHEPDRAAPEEPERETVDGRRADAHAKARQAIDDLGKPG